MKIIFDPNDLLAVNIRKATLTSGYNPSDFIFQVAESKGGEFQRRLTARLMSWTLVAACRHEPQMFQTEWLVEA